MDALEKALIERAKERKLAGETDESALDFIVVLGPERDREANFEPIDEAANGGAIRGTGSPESSSCCCCECETIASTDVGRKSRMLVDPAVGGIDY